MSKSGMKPRNAGFSLPESFSLLHRRLLVAEGQGADLAKKLGVSGDKLGTETMDGSQAEGLVSRVFGLENLLHALRLSVFRIETERELTSSQTVNLQEQLAALQDQCEEEQRSLQKEVKRLRDRLQQERDETQREANTLREQLHTSYRSQMDVAAAAHELEKVKVQLSRKLHQMKEAVVQEKVARLEAEQSHDALLQRVKEMEGEMEKANEQVKLLQAECHTLDVEGQEVRAELKEKAGLMENLHKVCQQLRRELEKKDTLASNLSAQVKSMEITLQKEQQENYAILKSKEELMTARDKVQTQNDQLEAQCSDLSSALRSLTEERLQLQAGLKTEQGRTTQLLKDIDLQLDTAKRNMQREVQEALAENRRLNNELETLKADHTKLKESSAAALDAAVNHQALLERTITRLRGELSDTNKDADTIKQEKEEACAQLECVRTNYPKLQEQLKQVQEELQIKECQMCVLCSELEYVQRENIRLDDQLHRTHMRNSETMQTELGEKLDELRRLGRQREAELHRAKQEINQLIKQVDELRRAKHHGMPAQWEMENSLSHLSYRSCDLSRTSQELGEKVQKLENLVSNQKSQNEAHKVPIKEINKMELNNSDRSHSLVQLRNDVASLQAELLDLSSSQQEELQAERRLTHTLQQKCQMLEACVAKLNEERDEAERKMKEVRIEFQQISKNLQEAHSWFRAKFHSLKSGLEPPLQEEPGSENNTRQDRGEMAYVAKPELERWASTLQRWEIKKELDRMSSGGYTEKRQRRNATLS